MEDSLHLLRRWRDGDEQAAEALFARYFARLTALADRRISPHLGRRIDAEDVVQSTYDTVFRRLRRQELVIARSGDFWKLLVAISLNKLRRYIELHTAEKRSIRREDSVVFYHQSVSMASDAISRGPSPDEAVAILDQIDVTVSSLEPQQREILARRMRGDTIEEIAADVERSQRTVRRVLQVVRRKLENDLLGPDNPDREAG